MPSKHVRVAAMGLVTMALAGWAPTGGSQAISCERLADLRLPDTTITAAEPITSGSFTVPGTSNTLSNLPPMCRVAGSIKPTSDSDIRFEVWLPLEKWNGKFAGVGNGGWAGLISYSGLAGQIRRGYAAASTDTGHQGNGGDASFAFQHPERLVDFAYRSEHETTVKGKAIVHGFYGKPPALSYWVGCSSGGYQGLMSAQRFPSDYDAILAGAPANNWTRLMAGDFDGVLAVLKHPDTNLPPAATTLVNQAVMAACDARDGVADGVLDDPRTCTFDPGVLECREGGTGATCLTRGQVAAVRRVYAGLKDPRTGAQLYPGLPRGSEPLWPHRNPKNPFPIPVSHYRWLVFGDPNWDWRSFEFADPDDFAAHARAEARLAPILNATSPDLTEFRKRGGRMIQYHGWNDQLISAQNSVDYYESVLSFFGRGQNRDLALADVQRFYRLFMIPGLAHCSGGTGTGTFDLQTALEQWVEAGVAPDAPVATRTVRGVQDRSRPLCPYPSVASYRGSGSTDDAANFSCRVPGR